MGQLNERPASFAIEYLAIGWVRLAAMPLRFRFADCLIVLVSNFLSHGRLASCWGIRSQGETGSVYERTAKMKLECK